MTYWNSSFYNRRVISKEEKQVLYDDMPRWWAFVAQIREGNEEMEKMEDKHDKTAQNGAQRVREARGISPPKQGQAGLTNG